MGGAGDQGRGTIRAREGTAGIVTHATFFRSGRTVSCIPIGSRTARKLFNSGFPFDESVR